MSPPAGSCSCPGHSRHHTETLSWLLATSSSQRGLILEDFLQHIHTWRGARESWPWREEPPGEGRQVGLVDTREAMQAYLSCTDHLHGPKGLFSCRDKGGSAGRVGSLYLTRK